jgi:hypothetical protein
MTGVIIVGVFGIATQLTAQKPVTSGRTICVPYDPAGLKITATESAGTWTLQRDNGAIFKVFADREDAEAGLAVAKQHIQLCYIGKSNTARTGRSTSWSTGSSGRCLETAVGKTPAAVTSHAVHQTPPRGNPARPD